MTVQSVLALLRPFTAMHVDCALRPRIGSYRSGGKLTENHSHDPSMMLKSAYTTDWNNRYHLFSAAKCLHGGQGSGLQGEFGFDL